MDTKKSEFSIGEYVRIVLLGNSLVGRITGAKASAKKGPEGEISGFSFFVETKDKRFSHWYEEWELGHW